MSSAFNRGPDWLAVAIALIAFVVAAGAATLGAEMLAESEVPTPVPTATERAVLSVPTRAATPTRFPSPTPAPTSTRAPTPTNQPTSVPTPTSAETPAVALTDEAIKAVGKSVVQVRTTKGTGTAFRIDVAGAPQFITSARVVGALSKVTLVGADGKQHAGTVSRREASADLALIAAPDLGAVPPLKLADDPPGDGEKFVVLGYASGAKQTGPPAVSRGTISGRRVVGPIEYVQTDAALNQGNAGGPVLSTAGKVLGVAAPGLKDQKGATIPGKTLVVPAGIVQAFLKGVR